MLLTIVSVTVFGFDAKNVTGGPGACGLWRLGARFGLDILEVHVVYICYIYVDWNSCAVS